MTPSDSLRLEARLEALHAPGPEVHPFALVDDDGAPVLQKYENGMTYAATYRTRQGATRGQGRWGGELVERSRP